MKNWISIQEYAAKYRVSVSTLRRRIKSEKLHFRFDDGKYFLEDNPDVANELQIVTPEFTPKQNVLAFGDSSLKTELLEEIKKAYALILQEKEEQIVQLKEQVSDLQTLVRVLESENERLNKKTNDGIALPQDPFSQFYSKIEDGNV